MAQIKSVIVSFDEADENFIKTLFKKMKLKVQPIVVPQPVKDDYVEPTKEEILSGLREAVLEVKAARRGEIKLQSADDFITELRSEEAAKKSYFKQPATS